MKTASRHFVRPFLTGVFLFLLSGATIAYAGWASGDYASPLGTAHVRVAGESVTITFDEIPGTGITGKAGGAAVFETGGGDVTGRLRAESNGAFSFRAEGETMLFEPAGSPGRAGSPPAPAAPAPETPETSPAPSATAAPAPAGKTPISPLAPLGTGVAAALASKRQSDPYFGFSLLPPSGWSFEKNANGFLMKSGTRTILASPHEMNDEEMLRSSLAQGVQFPQAGTVLNLEGDVAGFGAGGVTCRLAGTVDGADAKALNIALVSPHGGGASLVAWAGPGEYDASFEATARKVAESVKFDARAERPEVKEWRGVLAGSRLSIIDSDYTSGLSQDGYGSGSGYSIEKHFDFCADGSFRFTDQSSYSVDAGSAGVAGGANDANRAGQWSIHVIDRFVVLLLQYQDGQSAQHVLT
ncbi:MAG: hypothetical protein HKN20_02415, partial [Gemmatimonadetes bacterium]|nr:hypothetical protein [Gemmatimonadota bacterium]